jgi:hypothetical protein
MKIKLKFTSTNGGRGIGRIDFVEMLTRLLCTRHPLLRVKAMGLRLITLLHLFFEKVPTPL